MSLTSTILNALVKNIKRNCVNSIDNVKRKLNRIVFINRSFFIKRTLIRKPNGAVITIFKKKLRESIFLYVKSGKRFMEYQIEASPLIAKLYSIRSIVIGIGKIVTSMSKNIYIVKQENQNIFLKFSFLQYLKYKNVYIIMYIGNPVFNSLAISPSFLCYNHTIVNRI